MDQKEDKPQFEDLMSDYYQEEYQGLKREAAEGQINEVKGIDGSLFMVNIETGTFALAAVLRNGIVVLSGDEVQISGGDEITNTQVFGFGLDDKGYISFQSQIFLSGELRLGLTVRNFSAEIRALGIEEENNIY